MALKLAGVSVALAVATIRRIHSHQPLNHLCLACYTIPPALPPLTAPPRLYLLLAAVAQLAQHVVECSGQLTAAQRSANLAAFRAGGARILVASDAVTRGIDVEDVGAVVNYDAPAHVKLYVHRAGRTARAGKAGQVCISAPSIGVG